MRENARDTQGKGSPTFSLVCAPFFHPLSPTSVVQGREQCTRGSHPVHKVFHKEAFSKEKAPVACIAGA